MSQAILNTIEMLDKEAAQLIQSLEDAQAAEAIALLEAKTQAEEVAALQKRMKRYGKTPGTYIPTRDDVGLIDPSVLIDVNTNMTYNGAFGVIEIRDRRFLGYVYIRTRWIKFINCLFLGPINPTMETVQCRYAEAMDIVFEDCEWKPRSINDKCGNVNGQGYTIVRGWLHNGVDGLTACPADGLADANVTLIATLVEDMAYFKPSTTHSDGQTHNDGVIIIGGNVKIHGCNIRGNIDPAISVGFTVGVHSYYPNPIAMSAVMFNQRSLNGYLQQPSKVVICNSSFEGGVVCFNMLGVPTAFATPDGSLIENNRFKNNQATGTGGRIIACQKLKQQALVIKNNYSELGVLLITPRVDV